MLNVEMGQWGLGSAVVGRGFVFLLVLFFFFLLKFRSFLSLLICVKAKPHTE